MTSSLWVDMSLLRQNRHFRNVFIARTISLLGLGMLSVAIPMQVYQLSGDSVSVGLAMALEGGGMFIGLLLGGVLADRMDRKRLILFARGACGIGFLALAGNALLPQPALWGVYALAVWDGFFGAIGVTALLAAMPLIVGRDNLMRARAISMVSMRLATVLSPMLGGLVIGSYGIASNYFLAAAGTGLTLLPLLSLPAMVPQQSEPEHPLRALLEGLQYMLHNKVVFGAVLVGTLVTLCTAIRVMFPALVESTYGGGAFELGMMYSAVSLGATLGALLSGWANQLLRPGLVMQYAGLVAFACVAVLGASGRFPVAIGALVIFGYVVSVASLLQYSLVQENTPDAFLGRVNGIWTAQDALGDSVGSVGIGLLGRWLTPANGVLALGVGALLLGFVALLGLPVLRQPSIPTEEATRSS